MVKLYWNWIKIGLHSLFSPSFPVEFEAFYDNKFGLAYCTGFSYYGPKLWNHLPSHIRKTTIRDIFKEKLIEFIWEEIPSV